MRSVFALEMDGWWIIAGCEAEVDGRGEGVDFRGDACSR
jgi:hypothetical protein